MKRIATLEDFLADHTFGGAADRPFNGQRWTFSGDRGKAPVPALRYRDLADCIVRGWAEQRAAGAAVGSDNMDPDAFAQSILREVEHFGGGQ